MAVRHWPRHLQRGGPAAQDGVVRHREIKPEQGDDGADQAFGLAQRQAEHGMQRQRRRDCQARVAGLPPSRGPGLGFPGRGRFLGEPNRQAAALTQGGVVGGRVGRPTLLLWDVVAMVGVGLERQGGILEQR